jgi:hypothetical protein
MPPELALGDCAGYGLRSSADNFGILDTSQTRQTVHHRPQDPYWQSCAVQQMASLYEDRLVCSRSKTMMAC